MKAICADLNLTLKGWFEYFKHSTPHVFESIDGYVRGRLRSILNTKPNEKAGPVESINCDGQIPTSPQLACFP